MKRQSSKIWIAVIAHRFGQDLYASRTKRGIVRKIYGYVRHWWEREIPKTPFPKKGSYRDIANQYFELVDDEWLEVVDRFYLE